MQMASSAKRTWSDSASAVECTATVEMPSSRHARITRRAISPRLAMRTFLNMEALPRGLARNDAEERLAELHRGGVLDEDLGDRAVDLALDLVHQLHRLDDAERLALLHLLADVRERRGVGGGRPVERPDERRGDDGARLVGLGLRLRLDPGRGGGSGRDRGGDRGRVERGGADRAAAAQDDLLVAL